ncbi:MAG: hypothetical protein HKP44_01735, partial [Desulfofustis sp.]|nr:hypothetical protein [Desulfofustis sp.]
VIDYEVIFIAVQENRQHANVLTDAARSGYLPINILQLFYRYEAVLAPNFLHIAFDPLPHELTTAHGPAID